MSRINWDKVKKNTNFELKTRMGRYEEGTVAKFDRKDCDGDIWFHFPDGRKDWFSPSTVENKTRMLGNKLQGKWIVWNGVCSDTAHSEERAKSKAEAMVRRHPRIPVYIAEATAMVELNALKWTE